MTAPKNFRTVPCLGCGAPVPLKGSNTRPYCQNNMECGMAFAKWYAFNNVDKVGNCDVWRGQQKGNESIRVRLRVGGKSIDPRVLDLRDPEPDTTNRRYQQLCSTPRCVNRDHYWIPPRPRAREPRLRARLPIEPLARAYERHVTARALQTDNGYDPIPHSYRELLRLSKRRGWISVLSADAFCIDVLGVHPTAIYGNDFFEAA